MLDAVRVSAPAKINLNLKVLSKRPDGFHDIQSIFQAVTLFDELLVQLEDGKDKCTVFCREMSLPEHNTISSAYNAFCSLTGFNKSVRVELMKRIPAGGGLGGGSSDAASFVRALAKLAKIDISSEMSFQIASEVGSDVFFFLHCAHKGCEFPECALVSGRGEIVKPIVPRKDIHVLLVFPDVHSSTKEAYSLVDKAVENGETIACPDFSELEAEYRKPPSQWRFANSFTVPVSRQYPAIAEALKAVKSCGASFADMSGSGAVVFGIFDSAEAAETASQKLRLLRMNCVVTLGLRE